MAEFTEKIGETKTPLLIRGWPSAQDYNEAIQSPISNFADQDLKHGEVETNALGLPRVVSGAFASVYKVHCNNEVWAVRNFLRNMPDQQARYELLSSFMENQPLTCMIPFQFQEKGINVNGKWYPLIKMQWVEGDSLSSYVLANKHNSKLLLKLAEDFLKLCQELSSAGVAHGDLQHGNIIVTDQGLRLVDYDGMFVPSMAEMKSNEVGHRNYQHPARSHHHFGPYLDNFSAWIIYCSLLAFAEDPSLIQSLHVSEESLLFRREDLVAPLSSRVFATLENHESLLLRKIGQFIRYQLSTDLAQVSPLQKELPATPALPPLPKFHNQKKESHAIAHELESPGVEQQGHVIEKELFSITPRKLIEQRAVGRIPSSKLLAAVIFAAIVIPAFTYFFEVIGLSRNNHGLPIFLLAVLMIPIEYLIKTQRRIKKLVANGIPTIGVITAIVPDKAKHQDCFEITYEYDAGARRISKTLYGIAGISMRNLQVFKKVTVLYDKDSLEESLIYELSQFKAI